MEDLFPCPIRSAKCKWPFCGCDEHALRVIDAVRERYVLAAKENQPEQYSELLNAVVSKHEGETRHETALRYIRERENASAMSAGTAETPQEAQGEARQRDPKGDAR